ncbi:hypothetical protein XA68_12599 [Ophiocordyceps unilateralis]|uniref:Uncharacterized protein n=1 Tax=Ophiocordyceps unilateralis TaxID=268505 RepID=A0A2A9PCY6_OPHUN|nr:hypothetical protein XA68_12599 [Ophiocordyceps unilateralis]
MIRTQDYYELYVETISNSDISSTHYLINARDRLPIERGLILGYVALSLADGLPPSDPCCLSSFLRKQPTSESFLLPIKADNPSSLPSPIKTSRPLSWPATNFPLCWSP